MHGRLPDRFAFIALATVFCFIAQSLCASDNDLKPGQVSGVLPKVVYVSPDGNDINDGSSWLKAKKTIQAAVNAAVVGSEVWVKHGSYPEHLRVSSNVCIYGGFSGNEFLRSQRNWRARTTTIDGSGSGSVVSMPGGGTLDGFTICKGDIGVDLIASSPVVTNCVITGNRSGIYCYNSTPAINNNVLTGNTTGIYCYTASPAIRNNIFSRNGVDGGWAITCDQASMPVIVNNTLVGNGGIYGGGIHISDSSKPTVANNIVAFNRAGISGWEGSAPVLQSNCLYGNQEFNYSGLAAGTGDRSTDPLFANTSLQDYRLLSASPCIDAGNTAYIDESLDIDGQNRVFGAGVDVGADEWKTPTSPVNTEISPKSGSVAPFRKVTVTMSCRDADGCANISNCYLLINNVFSGSNAAYVCYDVRTDKLYVRDDTNTAWSGGVMPGADAVIENKQCRVYCRETVVDRSRDSISVAWCLEFKTSNLSKTCSIWQKAYDVAGLYDGWEQVGTITISTAPSILPMIPSSGTLPTVSRVDIQSGYSDPDGFADIGGCYLLLNTSFNGANGVYLAYSENLHRLYLRNDDNTVWTGDVAVGSPVVLENSRCKLYCAETKVTKSGNQVIVNWKIEFKPMTSGKTYQAWQKVYDASGLYDGWKTTGILLLR